MSKKVDRDKERAQIELYELEFKKIMDNIAEYKDSAEKLRERFVHLGSTVKSKAAALMELQDLVADDHSVKL